MTTNNNNNIKYYLNFVKKLLTQEKKKKDLISYKTINCKKWYIKHITVVYHKNLSVITENCAEKAKKIKNKTKNKTLT